MDVAQQHSVRLSVAKIKSGLICCMMSSTYPFNGRGDFGNSKRRRIDEVHVAVEASNFYCRGGGIITLMYLVKRFFRTNALVQFYTLH